MLPLMLHLYGNDNLYQLCYLMVMYTVIETHVAKKANPITTQNYFLWPIKLWLLSNYQANLHILLFLFTHTSHLVKVTSIKKAHSAVNLNRFFSVAGLPASRYEALKFGLQSNRVLHYNYICTYTIVQQTDQDSPAQHGEVLSFYSHQWSSHYHHHTPALESAHGTCPSYDSGQWL